MIPYFKIKKVEIKKNKALNENLDRIKLPCFCTYKSPILKKRRLGLLIKDGLKFIDDKKEANWYKIIDIAKQTPKDISCVGGLNDDLKKLIEEYEVNIIKGQVEVIL